MIEVLLQITAPPPDSFCAGLVARDGRVIEAAPRIRYMRGWRAPQVVRHCRQKGWQWEKIQETRSGSSMSC